MLLLHVVRGRDQELLIDVGNVPTLCPGVSSFHKFHPSAVLALGSYCTKTKKLFIIMGEFKMDRKIEIY